MAYTWNKVYWIFLFVLLLGCLYSHNIGSMKKETRQINYAGDTLIMTFFIDTSMHNINSVIQWGYLERFGYENLNSKLYFDFFDYQGTYLSHLPDSINIRYVKSRLTDLAPENTEITVEKISAGKTFGFIGKCKYKEGRVSVYWGELLSHHLRFEINLSQYTINHSDKMKMENIVNLLEFQPTH